jgi:hypothetical protein
MTVSSLSICLAFKKIADFTCGTRPEIIQIKRIDPLDRILSVSLPAEYQSEVFSYLNQHIGIQKPRQGQPLLLTSNQASAVVALALKAMNPKQGVEPVASR